MAKMAGTLGGAAPAGSRSGGPAARPRRDVTRVRRDRSWYLAFTKRLLGAGLTVLVLLLFAGGLAEQRWKEEALRAQVARQQEQVSTIEARTAELRDRLAADNPAGYRTAIEAAARRQLGLAYPQETVLLVQWVDPAGRPTATPPGDPTTPAAPPPPTPPNWTRWLRFLLGH